MPFSYSKRLIDALAVHGIFDISQTSSPAAAVQTARMGVACVAMQTVLLSFSAAIAPSVAKMRDESSEGLSPPVHLAY